MKIRALLYVVLLALFNACSAAAPASGFIKSAEPVAILLNPTSMPTAINTDIPVNSAPAFTAIPYITEIPTPEPLQSTPVPIWSKQGPGKVVCPILLYHRIDTPKKYDPYYLPPDEFRSQMQALKDWGYTSISADLLAEAINFGAKLPARPVVITFDDGDITVYSQAFPIMRELGFTGTNYLVVNYINTTGYMNVEQIKELAAAGWETGSHSMTHADLTKSKNAEWQVAQSLRELKELLGLPVKTFAYPFGKVNPDMRKLIAKSYRSGMGLGASVTQRRQDLYYLWRRPIEMGWSVQEFGSFLPWNTPLNP